MERARKRSARGGRTAVAIFYAACHAATTLVVLFVMLGVAFGDSRMSPTDIALHNPSNSVVEVAPVWRRYPHDSEESTEIRGFSRMSLLRGYVHERMPVHSVRPRSDLRLEFDNEDWGIDAVLVRERGDVWRNLEGAAQHPDFEFTQLQTLPNIASLAVADPVHAAFVDEHRDDWEPTFMTWLLLGPALLVVRVLWRAGAARLSPSTLTTWNWRLEVALTFWLMGAALVIAALAWELAS